jgi:glucose-6-phosphate 1-epimerase
MTSRPTPTLPASVTVGEGGGGLPMVRVRGIAGDADVYLQGAQVSSWNPLGEAPVLWMSEESRFERGTPIRGGIPICFPWFGAHPTGVQHGWARTSEWTLTAAAEEGDDVRITLALSDSEHTRASAWPHRFEARLEVVVGATLRLSLAVTNPSEATVAFEEALHSYLAVSDVRSLAVTGLETLPFVEGDTRGVQPREPLRIDGPITRVFTGTDPRTVVGDADRSIVVTSAQSANTVVWNPWSSQAATMADLGDTEWSTMLCVETGNVGTTRVRLPAGATHELVTTIAAGAPTVY